MTQSSFPPSVALRRAIVEAIRVEVVKRPSSWRGGRVFSGLFGYYADVDKERNVNKIVYVDGDSVEYFDVE